MSPNSNPSPSPSASASTRSQLDPRRLACGCAVKIDLQRVVYPALRRLRPALERLGVTVAEREDADIFPLTQGLELERRVYPFRAEAVKPLPPKALRAVTVSAVYRAFRPDELADRWLEIYRALTQEGAQLHIGKGHTIEAYSPEDEFVHFDVYAPTGPKQEGFRAANNDTIQLIDPTRPLDAPEQTDVALSNALNDLVALGAVDDVTIVPLYAAPSRELARAIERNIKAFAERYGLKLEPQPPVSDSTLLLGATVLGASPKRPPTFYQELREGDWILVHRTFGDLAPINALIEARELGAGALEGAGFTLQDVERAVEERLAVMRRPNLDVGRVVQQFCPEPDEPFDPERHLKATADLSGPGLDVFRELAELARRDLVIERVPLAHPEIVAWASRNFLLPNGTAGTNGAVALIARPRVLERVAAELERLGHHPQIIGRVGSAGGRLWLPPEAKRYIADWPEAYGLLGEGSGSEHPL